MRVHGVGDDGGGAAGVLRGAAGRGGPAVEQALQHLHPLLRAGRRGDGLQPAGRRGDGRPLRLLRAGPLPPPPPPLPVRAGAAGLGETTGFPIPKHPSIVCTEADLGRHEKEARY